MSKALKRRAFTKLGLLIALCAGVTVSILLSTTDGAAIVSWPNWFAKNHWLTTIVRVGLFLVAIVVFYSIRKRKDLSSEHQGIPTKQAQLHSRVCQLLLWFVSIELLFGQALLPSMLEFFVS